MKKVPTYFERDWDGDPSRVLDKVTPGCEWVVAGEGLPTRKLDGTCMMLRDGRPFKRFELKAGKPEPEVFEPVELDEETGNVVGWVPIGDGPEDKWAWEAYERLVEAEGAIAAESGAKVGDLSALDGTYELLGPKINKNNEGFEHHVLIRHSDAEPYVIPDRSFEGIRAFLETAGIEGVVFHRNTGELAKIKARDFGFKREEKASEKETLDKMQSIH